ncbi:hypothetical protein GGX14DRAFT_399142 [Mycena pura]|uniref:Uncharacterized protein n=1 Tax=Mycena pura TaxID=153505 RepID=A0AAD6Y6Z7_9AGAR|nr:hypothetical protein GGX14DRAFT_399142 [Mycena pura]
MTCYYGKLGWNPTYLNSLLIAHHFPLTFAPPVVSNTSHIPRFALGSTILRTRDAFIKSDPNYCPGFVWWPPGAMLPTPHRRPQVLCANTAIGCRRPGNSACSNLFHSYTQKYGGNISHSSSSDPLSPLNYAKAYAKNITPTYAHKLQNRFFTADTLDMAQRDVYKKNRSTMITVFWWSGVPFTHHISLSFSVDLQNDEEPHEFNVPVPIFPLFHPQDDSAICAVVGRTTCANYSFYNGKKWVNTSLAQSVKANTVLCLRTLGVTRCPGGPFATDSEALETSRKRALSLTGSDTQSPTRIRLGNSSSPTASLSQTLLVHSPSPIRTRLVQFDSISLFSLSVADGAIFRSTDSEDIDHESPVKKKELLSGSVM